jgi:hypothetical protein
MWASGSPHSTKERSQRGGPGFDPHGPHTILKQQPIANTGVPHGSP